METNWAANEPTWGDFTSVQIDVATGQWRAADKWVEDYIVCENIATQYHRWVQAGK